MFATFKTYCENRKEFDFLSDFDNLCNEIAKQKVETSFVFENVFQPVIIEGHYHNPNELMNELFDGLKRFFKGNNSPVATSSEDEKMPLKNVPFKNPYNFRNRDKRVLSRYDMQQQNQAVADDNAAADAHNQLIDRNALRKQAAEKTMKIRQEILDTVTQLKNHYTARLNDMRDKNISNLANRSDSQHRIDVLNKFTDYINDAIY